jgi:hypothetical protein
MIFLIKQFLYGVVNLMIGCAVKMIGITAIGLEQWIKIQMIFKFE